MSMSHDDHELDPVESRLEDAAAEGCEESRLLIRRRAFLGVSAGLFTWAFMPRSARAAGEQERLLVVLLRGGMDGLHVAPPVGDPQYLSRRRSLALDSSTLNPLAAQNGSDFFRLHPTLQKFYSAYGAGEAAVIHAIAPPLQIRSHFECQYNLEAGLPGEMARSSTTGWMNRLLSALPAGEAVRVNALQVGPTPMILAGPAPTLSWSPDGWQAPAAYDARIQGLYDRTDPGLADLLRSGMDIRSFARSQPRDGEKILNEAFYGAGRLLGAAGGPRIAALSVGAWDTHIGQTRALNAQLTGLDTALGEFRRGLGDAAWKNTVVACVSEFGRTAYDNGTTGTDHGIGTVALLYGGAVRGGRVITDWPGLKDLQDGRDLRATYDTRALFKGLLQDHLGVPRGLLDTTIFPQSANVAPMEGLIKTRVERYGSAS